MCILYLRWRYAGLLKSSLLHHQTQYNISSTHVGSSPLELGSLSQVFWCGRPGCAVDHCLGCVCSSQDEPALRKWARTLQLQGHFRDWALPQPRCRGLGWKQTLDHHESFFCFRNRHSVHDLAHPRKPSPEQDLVPYAPNHCSSCCCTHRRNCLREDLARLTKGSPGRTKARE